MKDEEKIFDEKLAAIAENGAIFHDVEDEEPETNEEEFDDESEEAREIASSVNYALTSGIHF